MTLSSTPTSRAILRCLLLLGVAALAVMPVAHADQNISLNKPVTGTPYYDSGTEVFPTSNIDNGQYNDTGSPSDWSFWLTPNGETGSATIDLEGFYTIDSIQLQNTHNRGYFDRGTDAYTISVSTDGTNFTPIVNDSFSTWPSLPTVTEDSFAPVEAQYVEFTIDSFYGSSGGLNEMDVFGTPAAAPEVSTNVSFGIMIAVLAVCLVMSKKRNPAKSID